MVAWLIFAIVIALGVLWGLARGRGTSTRLDRLRQVDPEMANRMEQVRAEHGLRGQFNGGTGSSF